MITEIKKTYSISFKSKQEMKKAFFGKEKDYNFFNQRILKAEKYLKENKILSISIEINKPISFVENTEKNEKFARGEAFIPGEEEKKLDVIGSTIIRKNVKATRLIEIDNPIISINSMDRKPYVVSAGLSNITMTVCTESGKFYDIINMYDPKPYMLSFRYLAQSNTEKFVHSYITDHYPESVAKLFSECSSVPFGMSISRFVSGDFHTKTDILKYLFPKEEIPNGMNKLPLDYAISFIEFKKIVEKKDYNRFFQKDFVQNIISRNINFTEPYDVFSCYFNYLIPEKENRFSQNAMIRIYNYIIRNDIKIRFSRNFLEEIHKRAENERLHKFPDEKLKIKKYYKELAKALPSYNLITTSYGLIEEGESQHNCVASYQNLVNAGSCAIFTKDNEDEHYTIEIELYKNKRRFEINQLFASYNRMTEKSKQEQKELQNLLNDYSKKTFGGLDKEEYEKLLS